MNLEPNGPSHCNFALDILTSFHFYINYLYKNQESWQIFLVQVPVTVAFS